MQRELARSNRRVYRVWFTATTRQLFNTPTELGRAIRASKSSTWIFFFREHRSRGLIIIVRSNRTKLR